MNLDPCSFANILTTILSPPFRTGEGRAKGFGPGARFSLALILLLAASGCAHHEPPVSTTESKTPYQRPLVSPGTAFAELPVAVQNTVRSEAGGAEIDHVIKGEGAGHTVYVIVFTNRQVSPPLYVAPDGSILNSDLSVAVPAPTGR